MNTNTVEILAENEITLENAKVEYDNGQTLFNGIYEATHRGVKVASVRETENGFTYLSHVNYKPVGSNYKTENLSVQELLMILDNIKYYYFETDISEQQLNVHQQSIINVLLKRTRRGAQVTDLIIRIEQLKSTWKNNSVMIEFLNGLNPESIFANGTKFNPKSFASHQIHALIRKGVQVETLKNEWSRRWNLEYPLMQFGNGQVKPCEDYR